MLKLVSKIPIVRHIMDEETLEYYRKYDLCRTDIMLLNLEEGKRRFQFAVEPKKDGTYTRIPSHLMQFFTSEDLEWLSQEAKAVVETAKLFPEFMGHLS